MDCADWTDLHGFFYHFISVNPFNPCFPWSNFRTLQTFFTPNATLPIAFYVHVFVRTIFVVS